MSTHQAAARPRYFAMELAEQFLAGSSAGSDDADRERIRTTILCAGQHLADRGVPGLWDELEPAALLEEMAPESDHQAVGICLDLIGLYGWLGIHELLDPMVAVEVLVRVRAAAPNVPVLRDLCQQGVEMLCALGADEDGTD